MCNLVKIFALDPFDIILNYIDFSEKLGVKHLQLQDSN